MTAPVAAIDCGTNSIRLLIARPGGPGDGALVDVDRQMEIVRLGHGVDRTGQFDPAAVRRTLDVTRRYADLIREHGVEAVRFVATSATRDAANRDEFIEGVREILGVRPDVISGHEEAALSFAGAVNTLPDLAPGPRLVVDIGGGSTELVLGTDRPEGRISLDIGSVRMTERHLLDDPPSPEQIAAAVADIDAHLDRAQEVVPLGRTATVIGVAGTVTTITALVKGLQRYDAEATHGVTLPIEQTAAACERLVRSSREERSRERIIHPGRVDVIGGGALIWARVLHRVSSLAGVTSSRTSEHDILDGIALGIAKPS